MVRPGLEGIPILNTLPDIPYIYASSPAFAFIVDALALSAIFGLLMVPMSRKILKDKLYGGRLGAVLGLVLGLSSAFALRAAGITLFQFWLTTLVAAVLIAGFLYMWLDKLFKGKYRLITGLIAFIIAWLIMDFWFAATGTELVRNIFGFLSLLGPMIFVVLVVFLLSKMLGKKAGEAPAPTKPGPLKRAAGWVGRKILGPAAGGIAKGTSWGLKKIWNKAAAMIQDLRKKSKEAEDMTEDLIRSATGVSAATFDAETSLDYIMGQIATAAIPTTLRGVEKVKTATTTAIARSTELLKNLKKIRTETGTVLRLIKKIEAIKKLQADFLSNTQKILDPRTTMNLRAEIQTLSAEKRAPLLASVKQIENEIIKLRAMIEDQLIRFRRLEMYLPVLQRQAQYTEQMQKDVQKKVEVIERYLSMISGRAEKVTKTAQERIEGEIAKFQNEWSSAKNWITPQISGIREKYRTKREKSVQIKSIAQTIKKDLKLYTNTYNQVNAFIVQIINKFLTPLEKALSAAKTEPTTPPATPAPAPAPKRKRAPGKKKLPTAKFTEIEEGEFEKTELEK